MERCLMLDIPCPPEWLLPIEMERLRECMKNSARLKELGLADPYAKMLAEYGLQDNTDEGDLIDDENSKCSKEKTHKKTNNQPSRIHPGGVKFQSRKRVFADQTSPRVTRTKKNNAQQDARLTPSEISVPPPSQANESHAGELVGNLDDQAQDAVEGNNSALLDNTHMTTGADAIDWPNQHSRMDDGDGFAQHDDNTIVAGGEERRDRGHNMGLGLQRLNRACRGKLQVVITEGHIRPVVPLVVAKFASECNIIVRNHVPILPHWKLYKKKPASSSKEKEPKEKEPNEKEPKEKEPTSAYVDLFLGKLKAKFDINTEDNTVKKGCIEMMQSAEMCQKNKDNRGKVKYHHTTGSRAYMVHVENLNVGYQNARRISNEQSAELEAEKKTNAELRVQVVDLSNKVQESEQARIIDREEMKRSQSEMEAKLNLLLSQIRPS
ncbi:unnamed protein product [Miscanthus lutarioriparius]|uniref:Uncharacterized protein n=1 Tax=Miscanthus lutarioriparius TaxID=422564 RepID=A0A811S7K7_9POAL|nr:unnamed protein product [Miscanthus lutarioriparius]